MALKIFMKEKNKTKTKNQPVQLVPSVSEELHRSTTISPWPDVKECISESLVHFKKKTDLGVLILYSRRSSLFMAVNSTSDAR